MNPFIIGVRVAEPMDWILAARSSTSVIFDQFNAPGDNLCIGSRAIAFWVVQELLGEFPTYVSRNIGKGVGSEREIPLSIKMMQSTF